MYDTERRVALVKQRVRENTRRRQRCGIYGLSAACMLLFAVLMQAADALIAPGQAAAWGSFGTGAMHVLCGLIVGGGLTYTWRRTWLKVAGTCGLLGAAITLHAIYNLLIAHGGAAQYVAYALPVLLVAVGRLSVFRFGRRE